MLICQQCVLQLLTVSNEIKLNRTFTGIVACNTSLFVPILVMYIGEPVPKETFTHSHLSWSSVIPYLLPPSSTIHGILSVQSTCLTVFFHNLCPSFLWSGTSTSYSTHFFTQSLSSFHSTCLYHRNLICCTEIISSNSSFSTLYLELYLVA